jgi:predicted nucleic acid-binding protein
VIDTNVFVPAIACQEPESQCYATLLRKCWKVVFSEQIVEEYQRVLEKFGYRPAVIQLEMSKLAAMNKYRECVVSTEEIEQIGEELSPRKDRHIIAPCKKRCATIILTHDSGIQERKDEILRQTGAKVLSVVEAQVFLNAAQGCQPG